MDATAELELADLTSRLPERHQACLRWFQARADSEIPWPEALELTEGRTFLMTLAKGIYKPEWSTFALSVRQTVGSPYADREPVVRPDGTWVYEYFQENSDPAARDQEFTNLALMECMRERVPVAVLRQTKAKPGVRYLVVGLALVSNWDAGYFFLEGFNRAGVAHAGGPASEREVVEREVAKEDEMSAGNADGRRKVLAEIIRRRGQARFRGDLLEVYAGRCCISGCNVIDALEAAHIVPYGGVQTSVTSNGLLLRADLHTLFDLGLLTISETMRVVLAPTLRGTTYGELHGRPVHVPEAAEKRPSASFLAEHRMFSRIVDA